MVDSDNIRVFYMNEIRRDYLLYELIDFMNKDENNTQGKIFLSRYPEFIQRRLTPTTIPNVKN